MSLRFGREFVAIPGPSVIPDRVLAAMHRPAPNIYEGEIIALTESVLADLAELARTRQARPVIYVANGHGAWEAAIANLFSRGERALVLDAGRFAAGWGEMAARMGVEVELIATDGRRAVDPQALEDRLRADKERRIKAVLTVQVDTASSALNDVAALRAAIDAAGHPALLCVDCIACLGSIPFEMDAWGVDVMVGAGQKGLMTPPGLGFVWVGPRAWAAQGDLVTQYWDWRARAEPELFYQRFCGTCPTHHLFALREALTMLLREEGLEAAWRRHRALAEAVRACVAGWAEGGALEFNVLAPEQRSDVVTTILARGVDAEAMRLRAHRELGLVLGVGLGPFAGQAFRIGHMGHLNPPMILGALGAAEAALIAQGAPLRSGLAAAAETIARHMDKDGR
ncbi:pyridoxal-phosphate-dependent aminotransferase family protein [Oceanicella actignis]|uniref:Alanine-glyoxylate transaminase / serine-glyoxylate transaminase / serine-pyruvate transaminase n=1 Tax=Oceanicella actignis TaxID=1189325 RepID=A0A1M7TY15_9RHOB|nr:aminotransferase class V-fold PLP-dependent enzyme [Oceanicella actignis]SET81381.1 alanine-glyoxylate transaminase / serine-glyoxylate transaminase / serine-pyruvate transaminase [Oceanicella actignis]SHN75636.1 alanine-glyoxylate transaminase / serine-glyoxylate transaminase / serine-pyruvate transaminase [Oceanicella actignis]